MPRIAIPCENNQVCPHFGHAPQFAFFNIDPDGSGISEPEFRDAPPHEPGVLPRWIAEQGATVVLSGGMGGRAQQLLNQSGIDVVTGVTEADPRAAAQAYAKGTLAASGNACDHGRGGCH